MRALCPILIIAILVGCSNTPLVHYRSETKAEPDPHIESAIRRADKMVIYALLPMEHWNVCLNYPTRSKKLLYLPRFHDFPVLGMISVSQAEDRQQWADLLASSFVSRPRMMCDFEPRHAVRCISGKATTDFLMCFTCGDLLIYHDNTSFVYRPVWSLMVRDAINAAFDQAGIPRDKP